MKIPLLPKLLLKLAIITFLINVFLLTQACYYLFKSNILKQKLGNLNPYYHLLTREEYVKGHLKMYRVRAVENVPPQ